MLFLNLFLIVNLINVTFAANILGIFPVAGKSVNILYNRLMKGLTDAGHHVTVISAYPNKLSIINGSYTDILLTGFAESYETLLDNGDFYEQSEIYPYWETLEYHHFIYPMIVETFRHPNVVKFLQEEHKFDLLINEYLFGEAPLILAEIYHCPIVLFSSVGGSNVFINNIVGNPLNPSYVRHPWHIGNYYREEGMNFHERFNNIFYYLYDFFHNYFIQYPANDLIIERLLPNGTTKSLELNKKVSFVLLGTHSSFTNPIPLAPNTVEIGGFHIDPPKKLEKNLQEILDKSTNGVIFFSMGTHLKSSKFSPEKIQMFLNIFRKLSPMKILWKFENDNLPGKPDNVLIQKWFPQTDILGHKNIKLFITHGGYGSTLEAVYHGKPCLMIPTFFDQYTNAYQAVSKKFALKISYNDAAFNEEILYKLIQELLNNPKYTEKAQEVSQLFHDRPIKPLDTALYWIEFVIRNKGAHHLKIAGVNLPWYKFYLLDVFLFISLIFVVVGLISFKLVLYCYYFNRRNNNKLKEL